MSADTVTKAVARVPAQRPGVFLYDTPASDFWGKEALRSFVLALPSSSNRVVCFVISPRGGRIQPDDIEEIKESTKVLQQLAHPYLIIVNHWEGSRELQKEWIGHLECGCENVGDVLFFPQLTSAEMTNVPEIEKQRLEEFVCSAKASVKRASSGVGLPWTFKFQCLFPMFFVVALFVRSLIPPFLRRQFPFSLTD